MNLNQLSKLLLRKDCLVLTGMFLFLGVWACLAVLDCCLQAATPVEEEILLAVMATMLEWRNSKEEWFLFNRFVDLCIIFRKNAGLV